MLDALPGPQRRLVFVLDSGPIHVSRAITDPLPACSPKLTAIEAAFGGIYAYAPLERRYPTVPALPDAIDIAALAGACFTAPSTRFTSPPA